MPNKETKSKGSIFFNLKKDSTKDAKAALDKCVAWMKNNGVTFSVSLRNDQGEYDKYVGIFNGFKDIPPVVLLEKKEVIENKGSAPKARTDDAPPW